MLMPRSGLPKRSHEVAVEVAECAPLREDAGGRFGVVAGQAGDLSNYGFFQFVRHAGIFLINQIGVRQYPDHGPVDAGIAGHRDHVLYTRGVLPVLRESGGKLQSGVRPAVRRRRTERDGGFGNQLAIELRALGIGG
jgi:hypothetical protein